MHLTKVLSVQRAIPKLNVTPSYRRQVYLQDSQVFFPGRGRHLIS